MGASAIREGLAGPRQVLTLLVKARVFILPAQQNRIKFMVSIVMLEVLAFDAGRRKRTSDTITFKLLHGKKEIHLPRNLNHRSDCLGQFEVSIDVEPK